MIKTYQSWIKPRQPFAVLEVEKYKQIEYPQEGISHFYEFHLNHTDNLIEAVPDGSIDLLFNIGENKVSTYISGTVFHAKEWQMGNDNICFGLRFQPGKGVLPNELSMNMLIDKDLEINGNLFGEHITDKIAVAGSMEQRMEIFLENYHHILKSHDVQKTGKNLDDYICSRIIQTHGTLNIWELEEETKYSACYIRRVFKEKHGLSPKQFARFVRFQYLLQKIEQNEKHYNDLALHCGYYDEAHMMKEFKKFTNITLNRYSEIVEDIADLL